MNLYKARYILNEKIKSADVGDLLMNAIFDKGGISFFKMVYDDKEIKPLIMKINKTIRKCLEKDIDDRKDCEKEIEEQKKDLEKIFKEKNYYFSDDVNDVLFPDIEEFED